MEISCNVSINELNEIIKISMTTKMSKKNWVTFNMMIVK